LVYLLVSSETSQGRQFLLSPVAGIPVWERLHSGFQAMSVDSRTGLHWNTPTDWSASNFHDALRHMGAVALTSCLRFRAAGQMAELFRCLGVRKEEETYRHLAGCLAETVRRTFQREDGWLVAATQVNRQPDTWSTAMAVYYGLLKNDYATAAAEALARACRDGSLSVNGYLRPTPVWADAIPGKVVWEDARLDREKPYGWYQFGGYWPQPAGYVCWTLARTDRSLAVSLARQLVEHTLRYELEGAPFEWINPAVLKDRPGEGKWYGPSAALPLEGFTRLSRDEDEDEGKR
ncbi:MAG TPA: hypothetical protein PKX93_08840, partial [bacterium]|nr:hypothetical protein [bacterium]